MWATILYVVFCVCWIARGIEGILDFKRFELQQKNQRPTQDLREHYYQSPYR